MRALLDVNVLLALFDADHVDHEKARAWISSEIGRGWASCALTQNGFVRIISQPRYPSPIPPREAIELLGRATRSEHHVFWPCEVSLLDPSIIDSRHIHGHRQLTDIYLLTLAVTLGGRFVTFDRSVPLAAVPAARKENLVFIG